MNLPFFLKQPSQTTSVFLINLSRSSTGGGRLGLAPGYRGGACNGAAKFRMLTRFCHCRSRRYYHHWYAYLAITQGTMHIKRQRCGAPQLGL